MTVNIGDVYLLSFPRNDTVQSGMRPGVVIQHNRGSRNSPNVIVLPLTTSPKKDGDLTHVWLPKSETGLERDSWVLCESPYCVPKSSLNKRLTILPDGYILKVAESYLYATAVIGLLSEQRVREIWHDCHSEVDEL